MGPRTKTQLHYEAAFEDYLRRRGTPYVAVDETKRPLFENAKLKNFDFVVYRAEGGNLLIDVKGRQCHRHENSIQNWVTRADIDGLREWEEIFGGGFQASFLFLYHLPEWSPTDTMTGLPDSVEFFCHQGRWYAGMMVSLSDYRTAMRNRSESWGTVHLSSEDFRRVAVPVEQGL